MISLETWTKWMITARKDSWSESVKVKTCSKAQIRTELFSLKGSYMQQFPDRLCSSCTPGNKCLLSCFKVNVQHKQFEFTSYYRCAGRQLWGQTLTFPCHEESCLGISQQSSCHSAQNPKEVNKRIPSAVMSRYLQLGVLLFCMWCNNLQ